MAATGHHLEGVIALLRQVSLVYARLCSIISRPWITSVCLSLYVLFVYPSTRYQSINLPTL